jgi:FixJ family two-component response regulator
MTSSNGIVFVVDDDASVRSMVSRLFRTSGWQVESFANATEFLEYERPDSPGCLLLEVKMPGLDGMQLQQRLSEKHADLPIIFMTGHGNIPMSVDAMKAGAVDFLSKPVSDEELLEKVQLAIQSHAKQEKESYEVKLFRERSDLLSNREREVMNLVITGMLNKQIASQLGITQATVKAHRGKVMNKLGLTSVADLVRLCERAKLS